MTSRLVGRLASLVVVASMFGAGVAQAGIVATATLIKDPTAAQLFTSPDTGLNAAVAPSWVSYRLSVSATGTDTIQAVDATIKGQLHQRWSASGSDGVYDTSTGNSTNATNGDSHFMATSNMLFASGPTEDNPASFGPPSGGGSPLSPTNTVDTGYGVGTSMSAVFGPPGAALTQLNLAYIVIPKGTTPNLDIHANILNPSGDVIASLTAADFFGAAVQPPVVNSLLLQNFVQNATVSGAVTATNGGTLGPAVLGVGAYTPGFGAVGNPPGSLTLPSWNPATGAFSWNTSGAPRGTYVWQVNATNAGGTGNGTVTVEQHFVPEPASLTLLGLAALGLVGFARRRS